MDNIARQSNPKRTELFREAANSKGVHFQIIEKDFWVCWTLKRLFSLPNIGPRLVFKGGTSLSKAYHVIQRFSEDIDVAIDRAFLGFGDEAELNSLSSRNRSRTIAQLDNACKALVHTEIRTSLHELFENNLDSPSGEWSLSVAGDDAFQQTLLFAYPRDPDNSLGSELKYVKPVVRIEMGGRPTNEPVELISIQSYAAEEFPTVFRDSSFELSVLSAERTFWEKATILHEQFHRSDDYVSAERTSRHYYDLFKLADTEYAERAIKNRELLAQVVANKKMFFARAGARYDDAVSGNLRLVPSNERIRLFERDYNEMQIMFFADPPKFVDILKRLEVLELQINQ